MTKGDALYRNTIWYLLKKDKDLYFFCDEFSTIRDRMIVSQIKQFLVVLILASCLLRFLLMEHENFVSWRCLGQL
jgi:hypothetical protein